MSQSVDELIAQLTSMKEAVQVEERRRDELAQANTNSSLELSKTNQALDELKAQLDELRRAMPDDSGDDIVCLNVGGRVFKVYRSTLTLFTQSVLAVMVSTQWSEGMRQPDGALFLDMDPDAFHEVVAFLRSKRIRPSCKSSFSMPAADVASYLGIPVDHIKGMKHQKASFERVGDKMAFNFVFDVFLAHPSRGEIQALKFSVDQDAQCSIYTRAGAYEGFLATREEWNEIWVGSVQVGQNMVPLKIQLNDGDPHAIYMSLNKQALLYSDQEGENIAPALLQCTPGRGMGVPFVWPPTGGSEHLKDSHRYFAGEIQYMVISE